MPPMPSKLSKAKVIQKRLSSKPKSSSKVKRVSVKLSKPKSAAKSPSKMVAVKKRVSVALTKGASKAKSASMALAKHARDNKKTYAAALLAGATTGLAAYKMEKDYRRMVPVGPEGKRPMSRTEFAQVSAADLSRTAKESLKKQSDKAITYGKSTLASGSQKLTGAKEVASKYASSASGKMQSSLERLRAFLRSKPKQEDVKEKQE